MNSSKTTKEVAEKYNLKTSKVNDIKRQEKVNQQQI
jgi:hypothetical protein